MKLLLKKKATEFNGYYNKIDTSTSIFHVRINNTIFIKWIDQSGYLLESDLQSRISIDLGKRINWIKEICTGYPGGGFIINEYGKIISPVKTSNKKYLIGSMSGTPKFHNPSTGKLFSLDNDESLKLGDLWNKPYVGIIHNLHRNNGIYRSYISLDEEKFIFLKPKYEELTTNLRKLRPSEAVRFIINPHGIVLTKVDDRPTFVMKIDYTKWFKEDI